MQILREKFYASPLLLAVLLLSAGSASSAAAADKKMTGTGTFVSMAGKQLGHEASSPQEEMSQWTAIWTFTSSDPDFDGIIETAPTQIICGPAGCRHQGLLKFRHRNGDLSWGYFQGVHSVNVKQDGSFTMSTDGVKVLVGGTGKFANIKGELKYFTKDSPFGATFNWTGQVSY